MSDGGTTRRNERLVLLGIPVAQPRHQVAVVNGVRRKWIPKVIDRKTKKKVEHPIHEFKASLAAAARRVFHQPINLLPFRVSILAFFPRPANKTWKTKPMPAERLPVGVDVDNVAKAVLDGLNGVAWADDRQVVVLHIEKWMAAGDQRPATIIDLTVF